MIWDYTKPPVPIDAVVSQWSDWSVCTADLQNRTRTVITPPSNGGITPALIETKACGTLPLLSFYFEGIWEADDFFHPYGGSVTYVDQIGNTVTQSGFFQGSCKEVLASSIIYVDGVADCSLSAIP